jgi:hypothetical protein
MSNLAKRLTALERRNGVAAPHLFVMPFGLTEAEKSVWEDEHTSPAALAAAGISPDAPIILVTFSGAKDETPMVIQGGPN